MKRCVILTTAFTILTICVFAQNFKDIKEKLVNPKHGQYHPAQSKQGYPYTTFYKPLSSNYIEDIRFKIIDKELKVVFQPIYNSIYTDAQKTYSSNDLTGKNEGVAPNSYYAKHAAFVYLMGFNQYGRVLRGTGDPHDQDTLMFFRTTALERLYNLDYEVGKAEKIQYRVKEMVHYLQAYDYLKAAGVQTYQ